MEKLGPVCPNSYRYIKCDRPGGTLRVEEVFYGRVGNRDGPLDPDGRVVCLISDIGIPIGNKIQIPTKKSAAYRGRNYLFQDPTCASGKQGNQAGLGPVLG